jgi:hypothetical protein
MSVPVILFHVCTFSLLHCYMQATSKLAATQSLIKEKTHDMRAAWDRALSLGFPEDAMGLHGGPQLWLEKVR